MKAVIIDDEYIVLKGLRHTIQWEKYDIEIVGEATDGNDGLRIIKETMPDIVLTDIRMPGIDGITLLENAKKFIPDAYFVIFSGFRDFEYAKKAVSLGVVEYIEKPVTVSKMEEALKKIYEQHISRAEYMRIKKRVEEIGLVIQEDAGRESVSDAAGRMITIAKKYLEKNFNEDISLEKLAKIARMNPTYFSMRFKKEVGLNYIKYLNTLRLEKAKALLHQGYKVNEVARDVGYTSTRYFSHIFKSTYGFTPEQYKNDKLK